MNDKTNIRMTRTACKIAAKNGMTADVINDTFNHGKVMDNPKVPGQRVVKKGGVALIGVDKDEDTFLVITVRAGGKVTKA